jgi:hypothetical protein
MDDFEVKYADREKNTPIIKRIAIDWLTGKCSINTIKNKVTMYKAE